MAETEIRKSESDLNLEELLQCPVCYEIPGGQIFQCNEGHHVCGRCKVRLDVCPVCRAFFFGTRNYAMEELIANFMRVSKKLSSSTHDLSTLNLSNDTAPIECSVAETAVQEAPLFTENRSGFSPLLNSLPIPLSCRGLYRCLCCPQGIAARLPLARLLNHLRYFHKPLLIETCCQNLEYVQVWEFAPITGRLVTALRVKQMGIFFLVIEMDHINTQHTPDPMPAYAERFLIWLLTASESPVQVDPAMPETSRNKQIDKFFKKYFGSKGLFAWVTMAASAWVSHGFKFTLTISGNDRQAIFTDSVWSVKACEGTLKKNGHTLSVTGSNGRFLLSAGSLSGKLSLRRLNTEELPNQTQPRGVLRIANRGVRHEAPNDSMFGGGTNNVATLTRSAEAVIAASAGSNGERAWNNSLPRTDLAEREAELEPRENVVVRPMSRSARQRMRRRLRYAFRQNADRDRNSVDTSSQDRTGNVTSVVNSNNIPRHAQSNGVIDSAIVAMRPAARPWSNDGHAAEADDAADRDHSAPAIIASLRICASRGVNRNYAGPNGLRNGSASTEERPQPSSSRDSSNAQQQANRQNNAQRRHRR